MDWNTILLSAASMITALGGVELIKFIVTNIQQKKKRTLSNKDNTVEFYKDELLDLQKQYRSLSEEVKELRETVLEQSKVIAKQGANLAQLNTELFIYRCITLNCPYRNKGAAVDAYKDTPTSDPPPQK